MSALTSVHPNDVARQIIGRDYLSFSALSLFRKCPLAFYFKYVAGLAEPTVSSALVFGSGVHSALELHFQELLAGNAAPSHDELLSAFWDSWNSRTGQSIRYGKSEDLNVIGQLADRVLKAFRESGIAKPSGTIVGVEEELRGCLVPDTPDILARLDLIVETDSELVVTDFKTARSRWSDAQAEQSAEQLLIYGELAKDLLPEKPLKLEFAVITKAKSPTVECHPVLVNGQQIERTKKTVQAVWRGIESRNYFPSPSALNCNGCPYRGPCGRWSG